MPKRRKRNQPLSIQSFFDCEYIELRYLGLFSPCWIWLGATRPKSNGSKYGVTYYEGDYVYVHRLFLWLHKQISLTGSYESEHLCHVSLCVNPDHIIPGNHSHNIKDMHVRNRVVYEIH